MAKFIIDYRFSGHGTTTIEADSLEAAEAIIDAEIEGEDFEPPTDGFDDIDFEVRELHPVTRDGREMWTTYPLPGDTRGHASALATSPLFAVAPEKEASNGTHDNG